MIEEHNQRNEYDPEHSHIGLSSHNAFIRKNIPELNRLEAYRSLIKMRDLIEKGIKII